MVTLALSNGSGIAVVSYLLQQEFLCLPASEVVSQVIA